MWWLNLIAIMVAGAIAGWFTNWLAIKMLFHPRRPIRWLFNFQGLLPSRRDLLIEKLAGVVNERLVNSKDISSAIEKLLNVDDIATMLEEVIRNVNIAESVRQFVSPEDVARLADQAFRKMDLAEAVNSVVTPDYIAYGAQYAIRRIDMGEVIDGLIRQNRWRIKALAQNMMSEEKLDILIRKLNLRKHIESGIREAIDKNIPDWVPLRDNIIDYLSQWANNIANDFIDRMRRDVGRMDIGGALVELLEESDMGRTIARELQDTNIAEIVLGQVGNFDVGALVAETARGIDIKKAVARQVEEIDIGELIEGEIKRLDLRGIIGNILGGVNLSDVVLRRIEKAVDIKSIIVEKLSAFDIADLENVIFGVARTELRFIIFIGIPLGATIGLLIELIRKLGDLLIPLLR
ncbi:MAG: DUF445 domain-containing protein [bacterium]